MPRVEQESVKLVINISLAQRERSVVEERSDEEVIKPAKNRVVAVVFHSDSIVHLRSRLKSVGGEL